MVKKFVKEDFIYCNDCDEFVDLWNYDSIEDAGHATCDYRYVDYSEMIECLSDCIDEGCISPEEIDEGQYEEVLEYLENSVCSQ